MIFRANSYIQGSYSFRLFKFPYFPRLFFRPFQVFQDLRFSCQFQEVLKFPSFWGIVFLKQFIGHKLWRSPKYVHFALFNYSPLSYIVLALSSAVTKPPNKTLIFHDFQGPTIKFHDFPGLENKILKFHDLYKPCVFTIGWFLVSFILNALFKRFSSCSWPC